MGASGISSQTAGTEVVKAKELKMIKIVYRLLMINLRQSQKYILSCNWEPSLSLSLTDYKQTSDWSEYSRDSCVLISSSLADLGDKTCTHRWVGFTVAVT